MVYPLPLHLRPIRSADERNRSELAAARLASSDDKLPSKRFGIFLALEADDCRPSFSVEQHERARMPANPGGDAMLELLLIETRE